MDICRGICDLHKCIKHKEPLESLHDGRMCSIFGNTSVNYSAKKVSVPLGVREDAVSLGVNALMYTSVETLGSQ